MEKKEQITTLLAFTITLLFSITADSAPLKEINWVGCGVSKAAFMQDLSDAYEKKTSIHINIDGGGATRGIREVATGKAHLGGSCRLPLVIRNGDGTFSVDNAETSVKMIPLGWDALVVIAHPGNAISKISEQQLRDVYTGKITNWRELGSPNDAPINLYARDGKISGVERTMRQLIFDNNDQDFTSRATFLPSSGKIEQTIEKDPNGLGVSGFSSSHLRNLKMLTLNDAEPSPENLKSGNYRYYRLLFLVAGKQYADTPELRDFVKFATSIEGQKVIEKSGTLPYMRGLRLLNGGLRKSYIQALETVEQAGIYAPGGESVR